MLDNLPFDIPDSWQWARLSNICDYVHRGKSPIYGTSKDLPIIAQKCNQWDKIYTEKCLFADESTIKKYMRDQFLVVGDLIVNSTGKGTVGRIGYIDESIFQQYANFVADSHITVVRANNSLFNRYLYLFMRSPQIQTDIETLCSGSTNQIELATPTICNFLIPIPPYKEQISIFNRFKLLVNYMKDEN